MRLEKYSFGHGDRFGRQGKAQLAADLQARTAGVEIVPVWNKSFREHSIIGTQPGDTRRAADAAAQACGWTGSYHLDADHIGMKTVDLFLDACDFFTLDVADFISEAPPADTVRRFVAAQERWLGTLQIPGIDKAFAITPDLLDGIGRTYLVAVQEAGRIYRHIAEKKGADAFITEVSFDEATTPQTPVELFFILAALAAEGIPAQTIAPKFSGRFNKGVDYVGSVEQFAREFAADVAVVRHAIAEFGLPDSLKLSVHSGSDKFSIYPAIHRALRHFDAGLHLKTAGTTWLEEVAGLALAGGDGLCIAKEIYRQALARYEELARPYATVIDIDPAELPAVEDVDAWDGPRFAATLRHDQADPRYNLHFRQLLHVAFKVAAEMGDRYLQALDAAEAIITNGVTDNLFERHIRPVFLGE